MDYRSISFQLYAPNNRK